MELWGRRQSAAFLCQYGRIAKQRIVEFQYLASISQDASRLIDRIAACERALVGNVHEQIELRVVEGDAFGDSVEEDVVHRLFVLLPDIRRGYGVVIDDNGVMYMNMQLPELVEM